MNNHIITPAEFDAELRATYLESELRDIWREREREIQKRGLRHLRCPNPATRRRSWREAAGGYVMGAGMGSARLHGPYGILDMAIRAGLTVRGYYNPSVTSGVTVVSSAVSALLDLHTSANNYAQATAADRPPFTLNDGTLRGMATFAGDGVSDYLTCSSYSTPAPGTTPVYIRAIIKNVTWTVGENIWNADQTAIGCSLSQNPTAAPNIRMNNGSAANTNTGLPVGSWGRIEEQFTNSTADYLKAISTTVTGTSANNNSTGTGRVLCSNNGHTAFTNVAFGMLLSCEGNAGADTSSFRTFADWWTTINFGSGLV